MYKKNNKGFSIVELLVIIFIMGLLIAATLANYRVGEKRRKVGITVDGIIGTLTSAQNTILTGKQIATYLTPISGTPCASDKSIAGNAVTFNTTQNFVRVLATDKCGAVFEIERYNFTAGTQIRSSGISTVGCGGCSPSPSSISVTFTPPFGKIKFIEGSTSYDFNRIDVVIQATDGANPKTLQIDGVSGRFSQ
jgi:type II secretory pathway pseudopilin PulG